MKATYAGGYMFSSGKSFGECTPEERLAILDSYYEEGGIGYVSTFNDVLFNEEANEFVADYLREKMAARVKDPALRRPNQHPLRCTSSCPHQRQGSPNRHRSAPSLLRPRHRVRSGKRLPSHTQPGPFRGAL
jgi:hypothetical protein